MTRKQLSEILNLIPKKGSPRTTLTEKKMLELYLKRDPRGIKLFKDLLISKYITEEQVLAEWVNIEKHEENAGR